MNISEPLQWCVQYLRRCLFPLQGVKMVKTSVNYVHSLIVACVQEFVDFYKFGRIVSLAELFAPWTVYVWAWTHRLNVSWHLNVLGVSECTLWPACRLVRLKRSVDVPTYLLLKMSGVSNVQTAHIFSWPLILTRCHIRYNLFPLKISIVILYHILYHLRSLPLLRCISCLLWCFPHRSYSTCRSAVHVHKLLVRSTG